MSRFFIDRPVFAWVIGIVLMLVGGIAITQLPIAQYPSIAPPQISISVTCPGASAQTVTDTVVRTILQQMSGLDGLEYISSSTQSSGAMEIDLTFTQGTDADIAQVQVQNKLALAEANLPSEVTSQGIQVAKATKNFMMVVGLVSTDGSMAAADISDYIASNIEDPLTRVPGVGDFTLFGSEYAMRIWLDPDRLYKYSLTVGDVVTAIDAQNVQVSSGEFGGLPATKGQRLDATIIGPSRLSDPQQFRDILLKVNQDGSQVRLGDVARVELGPKSYAVNSLYNDQPASGLALKLAPGANQITTEAAVKAELARLAQSFPPGLRIVYPLATEPYVTLSIDEVVKTLLEAVGLVFLVMLIFLQSFRATLIPTIAVPIVLLGSFGVLSALGYSINTLTMLAMVLAVGLLVDDAIVVVENVERLMHERGPLAARRGPRIDGRDHRRAGRHRPGAVGGVPADGLLRRLHRRDLPPVLGHHRLRHGAVGAGGADPDAGALRNLAEAIQAFGHPGTRPGRALQPRLQRHARALRRRRGMDGRAAAHGLAGLRADRRCYRPAVHPHAHGLPARRRPGADVRPGHHPSRLDRRADRGAERAGASTICCRTRRTRWLLSSPSRASTSPARRRTPGSWC